jgi:hypothetical protein
MDGWVIRSCRHSVGPLGRVAGLASRYVHGTQTQKTRRETSMPGEGFEHRIPVFEQTMKLRALARASTVIGISSIGRVPYLSFHLYMNQEYPQH